MVLQTSPRVRGSPKAASRARIRRNPASALGAAPGAAPPRLSLRLAPPHIGAKHRRRPHRGASGLAAARARRTTSRCASASPAAAADVALAPRPQDEVSVPEVERRCSSAVPCGGCTCAALPSAALCAAPSAARSALLYDQRLPCPLRRVRGFACDLERAAADAAAAAAAALWPGGQRLQHRQPHHRHRHGMAHRSREAPPAQHCPVPPTAVPPALPHAGAEWRSVLGIAPPTPLPCEPIRGEPPARRAAALVAAEALTASEAMHQPRTASG
jgi:hypothetical protein